MSLRGFDIIELERREKLMATSSHVRDNVPNGFGFKYCSNCVDTILVISNGEYMCNECGRVEGFIDTPHHSDAVSHPVTIGNSGKYYTVCDKDTQMQMVIVRELEALNAEYTGEKFSKELFQNVARQYNEIKNIMIPAEGENGKSTRLIRRGNNKREIIAALLAKECDSNLCVCKDKDIAKFMKLDISGFSGGTKILNNLSAQGLITLSPPVDTIDIFAEKFLRRLDLLQYHGFVTALVRETDRLNIEKSCHTTSKIAGAIWICIVKLKLDISTLAVDNATDCTKPNTFTRFQKIIEKYLNPESNRIMSIATIFADNNVPI